MALFFIMSTYTQTAAAWPQFASRRHPQQQHHKLDRDLHSDVHRPDLGGHTEVLVRWEVDIEKPVEEHGNAADQNSNNNPFFQTVDR